MYLEWPSRRSTPLLARRSRSQYQFEVDSTTARCGPGRAAKYARTAARVVGSCASRTWRPSAVTVESAMVRLCRSMPECSMMPPGECSPDATAKALWKHQIVTVDKAARRAQFQPCGLAALRPCGLAALRPCGLAALRP